MNIPMAALASLIPVDGESLASFEDRLQNGGEAPEPAPAPYEPTIEEIKAAIKNPAEPEPVRRFLREKLYGKGGAGRKGVQQDYLQKQMQSLEENLKQRIGDRLVSVHGHKAPKFERPEGMTGRQWKRSRKIMRQMAKAVGKRAQASNSAGID